MSPKRYRKDNSDQHDYLTHDSNGIYSDDRRTYVFGDNTEREKDFTLSKVLLIVMPFIIIAVLVVGFVYSYNSISDNTSVDQATQPSSALYENDEYFFRVVNAGNPLEESYVPQLATVNDIEVCYYVEDDLQSMLDKAQKDGISLNLVRGYVSYADQKEKFDTLVAKLRKNKGFSEVRASATASKTEGSAGESENQLGLIVKFSTDENTDFAKSEAYRWLVNNAINYGFIERYLEDNEQLSGMNADPSVYRYVDKRYSKLVRTFDMSFEELVTYISSK